MVEPSAVELRAAKNPHTAQNTRKKHLQTICFTLEHGGVIMAYLPFVCPKIIFDSPPRKLFPTAKTPPSPGIAHAFSSRVGTTIVAWVEELDVGGLFFFPRWVL